MSEGVDDPLQEALGELALARLALDEGDLEHCASHVARALVFAPALPEAHELLARLASGPDGGLDLYPMDGSVYLGPVVARAHLLAYQGKTGTALQLLAQASAYDLDKPWADVPWVETASAAPDQLVPMLTTLIGALPATAPDEVKPHLVPYLRVVTRAIEANPKHGLLHSAASALARKLGETKLALTWAQRGVELESTMLSEMWWANALRSAGQIESAIAAMRAAAEHDPANLAIQSDLAVWLAEAGRQTEALQVIEAALARDPKDDCVVHTAHSVRFEVDGDPDHLVALADFMRENTDPSHEHYELATTCADLPWLGHVPRGREATVNSIAGMSPTQIPVTMGISSVEPPSVMALLRRLYPGLVVATKLPEGADPRQPLRPGAVLWTFDGVRESPALPPPGDTAVKLVTALGQAHWGPPPVTYDAAVRLATVPPDELLSLLVHPPQSPVDGVASVWERTVQAWACLGLLHQKTNEPWAKSRRRQLLVEIAFGVEDWTTEAALYALVVAAWTDPGCRADVAALVAERFREVLAAQEKRPVSIATSVAQLAFITPGMPAATRAIARERCRDNWPGDRPYQPRAAQDEKKSWWGRLRKR